jgi:ribosomal protein L11 methyltransferase
MILPVLSRHSDPLDYKEVNIQLHPWNEDIAGILVAMLSSIGYESFSNDEVTLSAYIQLNQFSQAAVDSVFNDILAGKIEYSATIVTINSRNWNEIWESNFEPVIIDEICQIRAPFHSKLKNIPYSILIEPKMSFGTGHHATTSLMISSLLKLDVRGLNVLDMGCGTGLLAILSSMMGASSISAIDIDEWAYQNCLENIALNSVANVTTQMGGITLIKGLVYNVILANINRNVLLDDIPSYATSLTEGGLLLLSGFLESDSGDIIERSTQNNLKFLQLKNKNNWASLLFSK